MNNNRTFNLNGTKSSFSHLCVLPTPLCWEEGNEFLKSCSLGGGDYFCSQREGVYILGEVFEGRTSDFSSTFLFL